MILVLVLLPIFIFLLVKKPLYCVYFYLTIYLGMYEFRDYYDWNLITSPIVIRVNDPFIFLMILQVIFLILFRRKLYAKLFKSQKILYWFLLTFILYLIVSISFWGIDAIAEFRYKFSFIIVLLFTLLNLNDNNYKSFIYIYIYILLFQIIWLPINILIGNIPMSFEIRPIKADTFFAVTLGAIGILIHKRKKWKLRYLLIFLPFIVLALWTHLRSVWFAVIVVSFVFLMISRLKTKINFIVVILITFLAAASYLSIQNSDFLITKFLGIIHPAQDANADWRLLVWAGILSRIFGSHNYLGLGIGARFDIYVPILKTLIQQGAHNGYFMLLYYMGIPGVLIFIVTLFHYLKVFYKKYKISLVQHFNFDSKIYLYGFLGTIFMSSYIMAYPIEIAYWPILAALVYHYYKNDVEISNVNS